MDGTIPLAPCPAYWKALPVIEQYHLRVANVFHAGDGNMHPLILFEPTNPVNLPARKSWVGRSSNSALKLAAASVGNMASARKNQSNVRPVQQR
ncbi:FAD-linked oxidase C-terminal domain-containing protein [Escherichia coli]